MTKKMNDLPDQLHRQLNDYQKDLINALLPLNNYPHIPQLILLLESISPSHFSPRKILHFGIGLTTVIPKIMKDNNSESLRTLLRYYADHIVMKDEISLEQANDLLQKFHQQLALNTATKSFQKK